MSKEKNLESTTSLEIASKFFRQNLENSPSISKTYALGVAFFLVDS